MGWAGVEVERRAQASGAGPRGGKPRWGRGLGRDAPGPLGSPYPRHALSQDAAVPRKASAAGMPRKRRRRGGVCGAPAPEEGRTGGRGVFPFGLLPVDCQLHIFSFLTEAEKCAAAEVCRAWSQLMRTPRLWRTADFMRLGAFQSGLEVVLVSAREFERWKAWVHQYAYHLMARGASLLRLRASFNLADQGARWADFLSGFLEGVHCGDLRDLELNWTLTHLEPPDFYPPGVCSMTQVSLAKLDQIHNFQVLLEQLLVRAPRLSRAKLPFDWSAQSVALLTRFQQLRTLELKYFWSFKGVCPDRMQELTKALPNLKTLVLHVLVPVRDLGVSYALESQSLETLDVSQSRGLVFRHLDLPALKALRVKKTVRGIILNCRTRLALQSRWACLYTLLCRGTPNLRVLNNQTLLPHWREQAYKELHALLLQACYCTRHSDTWLL